MPKSLINTIGTIVCVGVFALGFILVVLPIWGQAVGVDTQTAAVANTNEVYRAQVDHLKEEQARMPEIEAEVATLTQQIPATGQLDDVFEVIGRAADGAGVSISSITAGPQAAFTPASPPEPAAPQATAQPGDAGNDDSSSAGSDATAPVDTSRQQVEFTISISSRGVDAIAAFLDELRAGLRLLSIAAATASHGGDFTADITAFTFVDAKER